MDEFLILVDEKDQQWGKLEKQLVHQLGLLHRAFSVFIFNSKGELLLQQRSDNKYHSGGLWTNTCCSHPRFGEETSDAVERRLKEEMGINCQTRFVFHFTYKAELENGLTENEFDHVYFGISDELPEINHNEVKNYKYIALDELQSDVILNPNRYTSWLKICITRVIEAYSSNEMKQLKRAI